MDKSRKPLEKREKPFKLVKVFSFTSLILIIAGTLIIAGLNVRWARRIQLDKSKEYAEVLVANLNHQIFQQFILPTVLHFGGTQLREKKQFERMDKVVRSTLHGFDIKTVNIYGMKNIISYSFDTDLIGRVNAGGVGYEEAMKGRSYSKLVRTGNFWEIFLGIPQKSMLVTFGSIKPGKLLLRPGDIDKPLPVLGVMEIVQDITNEYRRTFRYQVLIIMTSIIVMATLFLIMFYTVRNGEKIIEERARKRLKLEEELSRARHLSSLGEMTAGISHEIRNPLGIIRSSAELLKKKMAVVEPDNTIPDVIVEEATRLDKIISDFLNYARPKTPQQLSCRADTIIEKNLAFLESQLTAGNYGVIKKYQKELPTISGDADMLYQAFLNILINAMQAMPYGGNICIDTVAENDTVTIRFDNDGDPIDDEIIEKIWEPFFTTKDTGTGLGLGIVKNIVEAHQGTIRIANRPDEGVRVEITLPLPQESGDES